MNEIQAAVKEGEQLLESVCAGTITPAHFAWINKFTGIVERIDPLGSGAHSFYHDWVVCQYYSGSPPKNDGEWGAVFGKYFGLAQTLLAGKVKVVKSKRSLTQKLASQCVFHRRPLLPQKNLVFVIMPFTESWSEYIWSKQIKRIVESINGFSLVCRRADNLFGPDVMQDIYESIAIARIVIADITNRNANVFYELGMAHTLGKDVIILAQGTEHIPFDLQRFRHCIYTNDGPGYEKLDQYLPNAIRSILYGESP